MVKERTNEPGLQTEGEKASIRKLFTSGDSRNDPQSSKTQTNKKKALARERGGFGQVQNHSRMESESCIVPERKPCVCASPPRSSRRPTEQNRRQQLPIYRRLPQQLPPSPSPPAPSRCCHCRRKLSLRWPLLRRTPRRHHLLKHNRTSYRTMSRHAEKGWLGGRVPEKCRGDEATRRCRDYRAIIPCGFHDVESSFEEHHYER